MDFVVTTGREGCVYPQDVANEDAVGFSTTQLDVT